jgi:hypothetical protein
MADADPGNITVLGHRRWCLNPAMKKTGFGRSDRFTAMFAFDRSREKVPDFTFVAFPPRGYLPLDYFRPNWPWCVSIHPRKYKPDPSLKPTITELDKDLNKVGEPLKLNYAAADLNGFGIPFCLIFRPEPTAVKAGNRYLVEVNGLQPLVRGVPKDIRYVVEFVMLK